MLDFLASSFLHPKNCFPRHLGRCKVQLLSVKESSYTGQETVTGIETKTASITSESLKHTSDLEAVGAQSSKADAISEIENLEYEFSARPGFGERNFPIVFRRLYVFSFPSHKALNKLE